MTMERRYHPYIRPDATCLVTPACQHQRIRAYSGRELSRLIERGEGGWRILPPRGGVKNSGFSSRLLRRGTTGRQRPARDWL